MTLNRRSFLAAPPAAWLAATASAQAPRGRARNLVLVTTDGLRWQELFRGAEASLMNKQDGGVADVDDLRRRFWRDSPEARREALLPFLWNTFVPQGQLYGNRDAGSHARVTNGKNFSYPGYNELLTGSADPRVDSNAKKPNDNVTVLEWLHHKPEFRGRVAAFGSWDVFPYIINEERSGIPVRAGWEPIAAPDLSDREQLLNTLLETTYRESPAECYDSFTFQAALEHLRRRRPRVLYIALGETDHFAHAGRYDHYLHAAHQFDRALRVLWETFQELPEYKDRTTLVVTTDHGRGDPPTGWKSHGANVPGAEWLWIGVLGPDTPALGMRRNLPEVTQAQVAATVAALLGQDFRADFPQAAPPIADAVGSSG